MSGSNTICAVTAALEAGIVPVPKNAPSVEVVIDTAVGVVRTTAHMDGPKVRSVTVANVPAYVVELDYPLAVPEIGTIPGWGHCVRRNSLGPNRCPQLWTRLDPPAARN